MQDEDEESHGLDILPERLLDIEEMENHPGSRPRAYNKRLVSGTLAVLLHGVSSNPLSNHNAIFFY